MPIKSIDWNTPSWVRKSIKLKAMSVKILNDMWDKNFIINYLKFRLKIPYYT